jgi:hypothetical protein
LPTTDEEGREEEAEAALPMVQQRYHLKEKTNKYEAESKKDDRDQKSRGTTPEAINK